MCWRGSWPTEARAASAWAWTWSLDLTRYWTQGQHQARPSHRAPARLNESFFFVHHLALVDVSIYWDKVNNNHFDFRDCKSLNCRIKNIFYHSQQLIFCYVCSLEDMRHTLYSPRSSTIVINECIMNNRIKLLSVIGYCLLFVYC